MRFDPCALNHHGQSALFAAVCAGHGDVCSFLVEKACRVDGCDKEGRTPLFHAVRAGHAGSARTLIGLRADVRYEDSMSQTPLFFAAARVDNSENVSLLLEASGAADATDSVGQNPLFYAAREGADDAVQLLCKGRADVNKIDAQGKLPIFYAIRDSRAATATLLLDTYAAWPPADRAGHDLIDMARNRNLADVVERLENKAQLREALHNEGRAGGKNDIDKAIRDGAHIGLVDAAGRSALHAAAARRDEAALECCRHLVEVHGASVHLCDKQKQTPLFAASTGGTRETVSYLLDQRCDPNVANDRGETVLFDAARHRRLDIVTLLLERGSSTVHRSATTQTPIFCATGRGCAPLLAMLLDSGGGATASDTDNEGRTALFGLQDPECARLLIERRCDVDTRDSALRTALFVAEGSVIPQLLLQAEAAVDARDRQQQTPLFFAAARGDIAMVRVLIEAGANGNAFDTLRQTPLFSAVPRAPVEVVRMLICEAWADPLAKDAKGTTALTVARRARPPPKFGVMEYINRMSKPLDIQSRRGSNAPPAACAAEKPKHYRFAFVGPTGSQLEVGSPQYEEALLGLAERCPWLKIDLWPTRSTQADTMCVD